MENTKTREQSVDTDPMYDNREVVTDAEAEMEREQTADNMSEDDAPETDKSAETAGASGRSRKRWIWSPPAARM